MRRIKYQHMSFSDWRVAVNQILIERTGKPLKHYETYCGTSIWARGATPAEGADDAIAGLMRVECWFK